MRIKFSRTLALVLAAGALALLPATHVPAPALAAAFVVDSTSDGVDVTPGDGACATLAAECTLRAAVQETNALPGPDKVTLPVGTYTMSIGGSLEEAGATGDFDILDDLTINGLSTPATIVNGNGIDRVFDVQAGATASIEGMTVTNGSNGGIRNTGTLSLTRSTVSGNTTPAAGGGVDNIEGTVHIVDSTISDNSASLGGGGIVNSGAGALFTLTNSTISGNETNSSGGGILQHLGATMEMNNVTIWGNTADVDGSGDSAGGGLKVGSDTVLLKNTLIAGNINASGAPDCVTVLGGTINSQGYNLIGNNSACDINTTAGDQIGTNASPIDPLIGTLRDNGGPTKTHAIPMVSPAIDAGNPAAPGSGGDACEAVDQRAESRPMDGDTDGDARCDIGAFEFAGMPPCPFPDLAPPDAGCLQHEFNAELRVKAPDLSPLPLDCNIWGQLAETHSALGDVDMDGLEDIEIDVYYLSAFIDCPGPVALGSSLASGGTIEEKANHIPGVLEFPANGDFILCINADTYPLGYLQGCSHDLPAVEKQPLHFVCDILSLTVFDCTIVEAATFLNSFGVNVATVNSGKVTTGGIGPEPIPTATATPQPTPTPTPTISPSVKPKFDTLLGKLDAIAGPPGIQTSLRAKVSTALRLAQRGNACASANVLGAFINQVEAKSEALIPTGIAPSLIAQAKEIIDQLRPPGTHCGVDPDLDGDQMGRSAEITLGTDPSDPDTDNDSLSDGLELLEVGSDPLKTDTDADGCTDSQELGPNANDGGLRDPTSFWDFIDQYTGVPLARDGGIVANDISALVARFGTVPASPLTEAEALAQSLTVPSDTSSYHASSDRGGADPLGNLWDLFPPDGGIVANDISALVAQFGHICA